MNRRQFAWLGLIGVAAWSHAGAISPVASSPIDFAEAMYRSPDRNATYRTAFMRSGIWPDDGSAIAHMHTIAAGAGSDLPPGEYYQTDVAPLTLPPLPGEYEVMSAMWATIEGVAAFTIGYALVTMRNDTTTLDIVVTTDGPGTASALASQLAGEMAALEQETGTALAGMLPGAASMPDGLVLEYTRTPEGTFDADGELVDGGTPIPWQARNRDVGS